MQVNIQRLLFYLIGLGVALLLLTFVPYVLVIVVIIALGYYFWKKNNP
ncbi:hypothetical protein BH11PAT1_BH11PAT1_6500 [soil metagenome]